MYVMYVMYIMYLDAFAYLFILQSANTQGSICMFNRCSHIFFHPNLHRKGQWGNTQGSTLDIAKAMDFGIGFEVQLLIWMLKL